MKLIIVVIILSLATEVLSQDLDNIAKQEPLILQGGINLRTMFYQAKGIRNRREPFTYILSGSPTLSIYGISLPFSFILTEQERSFRQPFNQVGVSPTYKWIKLHAGYRDVSFSPFTLDGHTILGGGFELNPGKFYIGMMYGRLNREVVANNLTADLQAITFNRKGISGKIGYGDDVSNIYVSFLKGKDDPGKLSQAILDTSFVTPAENLVFSLGGRLGLFKKFFIEGDGGISLFTKNIESAATIDSAAVNVPAFISSLIIINAGTEANKAYRIAIGYKNNIFGLNLQYRRIDPNFQSMGAYFFQNDLENYTINPSVVLLKSKVRLTGSIGIQQDNLSNTKQATARRVISSLNGSFNITEKFGLDLTYSNFATSQTPVAIQFNDSIKVAQTTQNFSFTPRYIIQKMNITHVVVVSGNYMKLNDFSKLQEQRDLNSTTAFANYQITFVPIGVNVNAGLNYAELSSVLTSSKNEGVTFGISKSLFKNVMQVRLSSSIIKNIQNETSGTLFTHFLSGSYRVKKNHSFGINFNFLNNRVNNDSSNNEKSGAYPNFSEFRGDFSYNFNF